jgi:septal ring factor EnvC (AmiA/AmiB activator)
MRRVALALLATTIITAPAEAQPARRRAPLQRQLDQALQLIEAQRARLDAQAAELAELRRRIDAQSEAVARAESASSSAPAAPRSIATLVCVSITRSLPELAIAVPKTLPAR